MAGPIAYYKYTPPEEICGEMKRLTKGKGVWVWGAVAALLVVGVWFSTQAFSAAMSVTAQPLQNPGGDITYTSDWSSGSSVITRHEDSTASIDASDQITQVTVGGTKSSGAAMSPWTW